MRIDPISIFAHTIASLPAKVVLVFIAIFIGILLPSYLGSRGDFTFYFGWHILAYIAVMPIIACSSGWWALVAVPLFLLLIWRVRNYLHDDHNHGDLFWITLLTAAVTLRTSGRHWLFAATILSLLAGIGWYFQKYRPAQRA